MVFDVFVGFICRSPDDELDDHIFDIFDLQTSKLISLEAMTMMLMNLPDLGFSSG